LSCKKGEREDMNTDSIINKMREAGKKLQDRCHNDLHLFSQMPSEGMEKHKKEKKRVGMSLPKRIWKMLKNR